MSTSLARRCLAFALAAALVGCSTPAPSASPGSTASPEASACPSAPATLPPFDPDALDGLRVEAGAVLRWDPVAGAARYAVIASRGVGDPWIWLGTATSVRLGEEYAPASPLLVSPSPAASPTASPAVADYDWMVIAFDADGAVLASSRPVRMRCERDACRLAPDASPG